MQTRPVWAEISLDRLTHNYRVLQAAAGSVGSVGLIAVVKANAYGHGALACAAALHGAGAVWLGVTHVAEGVAVRGVCPDARILVMSGIWEREADAAIEFGLTPVVWEAAHLEWLEAAAGQRGLAAGSVVVHLEIDTGMSRQGVRLTELAGLLDRFERAKSIAIEGVMTHFHSPEFLDGRSTAQLAAFDGAMRMIVARGFRPNLVHAGNSATAFSSAEDIVEIAARHGAVAMLRPGLSLYGYAPRFRGGTGLQASDELLPVLAWKTRVVSLRTIEAGESAGYCATFHAHRRSLLALLPAGYADGLNRLLSNRGQVLIRGRRAAIVGRVSMDLTIVDVTDVEGVELDDEAVLIGEQDGERITAYELADLAATIPYEVLCNISARVRRVTLNGNASDGLA